MLQIDYNYIPAILVDTLRRTPTRLDWLGLTTSAIKIGMDSFIVDFTAKEFLARHSSQVISVEHLLNTLLSPTVEITITDGNWYPETFVYILNESFSTPTYLYTTVEAGPSTYIYTQNEFDNEQVDFFVNVSNTDIALEDSINYYIKQLLPAGKTYEIIFS